MSSPHEHYGMGAWKLWEEAHPSDLSEQRLSFAMLAQEPASDVHSFRELQRKVAFLNVMNEALERSFRYTITGRVEVSAR